MSSLHLKSQRFRHEREASWKELEQILNQVEKGGLKRLSDAQIKSLPTLYRSTLSSLSVARATSLDQNVIAYLESLSLRTYYIIYGTHKRIRDRLGYFFKVAWPQAVQSMKRETLISACITLLGIIVAYGLCRTNPDWFFSFVPESLADGRNPAASAESLRDTLYHDGGNTGLGVFATYLFGHNSRIAILAFALGFAFGIPTILLLLYNGLMLGAFIALFTEHGLGFELGGWLIIHGSTELRAIILAGAAGLYIGKAIAFPGRQSRLNAASLAGRQAGTAMAGVVFMLICAGLLEGFGRQLITSDWIRYAIGLTALLLWLFYFYGPRPKPSLEPNDTPKAAT